MPNQTKLYWNSKHARLHGGSKDDMDKYIKFSKRVLKYIDIKASVDIKILDIGCGDGVLTNIISNNVDGVFYGCDFSKLFIESAMINYPHIEFTVTDITGGLNYEDNYFDLIYSHGVIQYVAIDKMDKFFSEIHRVLKDDGSTFHLDICDKSKFFFWYASPFSGFKNFIGFIRSDGIRSYITNKLWNDGTWWHSIIEIKKYASQYFHDIKFVDSTAAYRTNLIANQKKV